MSLLANTYYKMNVHVANLKAFGAQWYENDQDNPEAAAILDEKDAEE